VKLFCFQANKGARRFYERHGFVAEAFGEGSANEEGLPDILYVRRAISALPTRPGETSLIWKDGCRRQLGAATANA
jgi:hypothetical protein